MSYLHGISDYGDSVDDEWLIVYLLWELTKSHPDLWVRVADSDGEFLLIEAASALPGWLSPDMDRNRVWIHGGNLYIIPFSKNEGKSPPHQPDSISLSQAVEFLKYQHDALFRSPSIESEAFYRLQRYPAYIAESAHHAMLTIPRKLAHILHQFPQLVAPAVEAFYLRDPISLTPILSSSPNLRLPPEDLVTTSVRFSRLLFAQLKSQRFDPPPRWLETLRATSALDGSQSRLETGMKLTCGFELLCNSANGLACNRKPNLLVAAAIEAVDSCNKQGLPTDEDMKLWRGCCRDDDETWMHIEYDDLEQELDGRRHARQTGSGFGDHQTGADLRKIVSRFEAFLRDDNAGADGAELRETDGDDSNSASSSDTESWHGEGGDVDFDEEAFIRTVRQSMMPLDPSGMSQRQEMEPERSGFIDEAEDIGLVSSQIEAELRQHAALELGAVTKPPLALEKHEADGEASESQEHMDSTSAKTEEDSENEADIDLNLAQNLLESFKSQAGLPGPTGNLLGLMGFRLPRDEDGGRGD